MNCNCQITYCFPSNQRIRQEQKVFPLLTFPRKLAHCFVPGDRVAVDYFMSEWMNAWTNDVSSKHLWASGEILEDVRPARAWKNESSLDHCGMTGKWVPCVREKQPRQKQDWIKKSLPSWGHWTRLSEAGSPVFYLPECSCPLNPPPPASTFLWWHDIKGNRVWWA